MILPEFLVSVDLILKQTTTYSITKVMESVSTVTVIPEMNQSHRAVWLWMNAEIKKSTTNTRKSGNTLFSNLVGIDDGTKLVGTTLVGKENGSTGQERGSIYRLRTACLCVVCMLSNCLGLFWICDPALCLNGKWKATGPRTFKSCVRTFFCIPFTAALWNSLLKSPQLSANQCCWSK